MKRVDFNALPLRVREKVCVEANTACRLWTAQCDKDGYGKLKWNGRTVQAHRFIWEFFHGPIPAGLQIDHLCKTPGCVNPEHLELVTWYENVRRGDCWKIRLQRTHCLYGHSLADCYIEILPNGRQSRRCRVCKCAQSRKDGKRYRQMVSLRKLA